MRSTHSATLIGCQMDIQFVSSEEVSHAFFQIEAYQSWEIHLSAKCLRVQRGSPPSAGVSHFTASASPRGHQFGRFCCITHISTYWVSIHFAIQCVQNRSHHLLFFLLSTSVITGSICFPPFLPPSLNLGSLSNCSTLSLAFPKSLTPVNLHSVGGFALAFVLTWVLASWFCQLLPMLFEQIISQIPHIREMRIMRSYRVVVGTRQNIDYVQNVVSTEPVATGGGVVIKQECLVFLLLLVSVYPSFISLALESHFLADQLVLQSILPDFKQCF